MNESIGIILVLSTASVASDNVMDEVNYAITKGKHIIPILLDDCEIPFRIARIQQIDVRGDYKKSIDAIIATIYAHAPLRMWSRPLCRWQLCLSLRMDRRFK